MLIKIKSDNPHLLDILNKNPNTDEGLYLKSLVNGVLIGNIISANQYDIFFQDSKYSFTNFDSNQLDFQSFCDGRIPLKVLTEFFKHLLDYPIDKKIPWLDKTYSELDTYPCEFFIDNIWIESNYIKNNEFLLSRYFDGFELTAKGRNIYSLKYTGQSILETFNIVALSAFLVQMVSKEPLFLDNGLVDKYIRILSNTPKAPYFIYYLISKKLGDKYKSKTAELESAYSKNYGVPCKFTSEDTHTDRIRFVRNNLSFENPIIDFGCGELSFFRALARKVKNSFWSYDLEDFSELYEKLKIRYEDKDWKFTQNLSDIPTDVKYDVIISEVIEHNDIKDAEKMIKDLFSKYQLNSVIITTPNVDFNQYYQIDTLRHPDHVQELTRQQWENFISNIIKDTRCKVELVDIGDSIGDICTSFGAILRF